MADLDDFEKEFDRALDEADAEFDAKYADELAELKGLSPEELKAITPDATSEDLERLIETVRASTARNESNAVLADRIRGLGEVAVSLAKRAPNLAAIL